MSAVQDYVRARTRALAAGDHEAADYLHQQALQAQQAQDRTDYDPTSGMGADQRLAANLGAGMEKAGIGLGQLLLPKPLERAVGITDQSINERRSRDETLANSTYGGSLVQGLGESLPYMAVPGGAIARGLGAIPKAGAAIRAAGIGQRVLPTVAAEGAVLGGAQGAATPTTSEDSVVGNTLAGMGAGAVAPAAITGVTKAARAVLRPFVPALQKQTLAGKFGESIDTSPGAQADLARKVQASEQRGIDAPQSLATISQDPKVARMELAARGNPETASTWQAFDQAGADARWKSLDAALGNAETVKVARTATNAYARDAIPEVFKAVNKQTLSTGLKDFRGSVQSQLESAVKDADPARQEVYGYVQDALDKGGGSPQMLWNIRKTLSEWIDGVPPPGKEGTRGAKMDAPIMETRKAIDDLLNAATDQRWGKFLGRYGEFARKESAQKAGQNIRNAFFDETLITPRGVTTTAGNPSVTRTRLEQALLKHGKNDFGPALDSSQRSAIDQVLTDLRGEEILSRAKSAMTGGGGSQTAPLEALMKRSSSRLSGGWISDLANVFTSFSAGKQQQMLNQVLQSPADALALLRQAERMKGPLSGSEKKLVQATRAVLASPAMLVSMDQQANAPSEQPGQ